MAKKVLITGGAGFVGSHLCERLVNNGHKVVAFDNLFAGSLDNLKSIKNKKNFTFIKGDVGDKKALSEAFGGIDTIYHLAAIVGVSLVVTNPVENISVNIEGTKNVAEVALRKGVKVVFASSSEVYGKNDSVPLKEDSSLQIFGSTKVSRWSYGMAKALGEQILWKYSEKGFSTAVVRLFNSYGPRGINSKYSNVIPKFVKLGLEGKDIPIHGDGKQTRCFCYVGDTVKGLILAEKKLKNEVINLGSNKEISIKDLAKKIIKLTGSKSKIVFIKENKIFNTNYEGVKRRVPDIKRARSLGFDIDVELEEGLKKTIAWTKENLQ